MPKHRKPAYLATHRWPGVKRSAMLLSMGLLIAALASGLAITYPY